ncbi:DEAD/DEAH box helicase family protein [Caproiciproducens faecalis]|uniref:DNA helicase n=1 Tax=Caproiciproducens faecalis TaxID=2820301 RepID=A0ABS7DMB6_9FIRM|nr:DNA helicase [Caproiciproducens faecalis]MBW7572449.1 DNA helicase [Caproiciproducens faecalis]
MSNINQTPKEPKYITDLISPKIIETWHDGDVIIISANCGRGKSYFIKNPLYDFAKASGKKILMLLHRINTIDQFQAEIERNHKTDEIEIRSYQKTQIEIQYNIPFDWVKYQFIISDEFHYFLDDSSFNTTTDLSLDKIINQKHAVKIFMSATGEDVVDYITDSYPNIKPITYTLTYDYSFIRSLTFYNKEETTEEFLKKAIKNNKKSIFFIQSARKAYSLYQKYKKDCLFCCSSSNSIYYKYVNKEKINSMLKNEKFDELILITTSCLDAGVNIIDRNLHDIVIDIKDVHSLLQCIGRKRIQDETDGLNICIKSLNNMVLGGLEQSNKHQIEMADYLKAGHTTNEYIDKFKRQYDKSYIVFDAVDENNQGVYKKINPLMYRKKTNDLARIKKMKELGEFGYCKYIQNLLGVKRYNLINENYSLEDYLHIHQGQIMYQRTDRKDLIDIMNVRRDGKLRKRLDLLNAALKEESLKFQGEVLNFRIREFSTSKVIDGKQKRYPNAWIIEAFDWTVLTPK